MKRALIPLIVLLLLTTGCSEHDDSPMGNGPWSVAWCGDEGVPTLTNYASFESAKVEVNGQSSGEAVVVSCDDDWLSLQTDTLPEDGVIAFSVQENEGDSRRTAHLTIKGTANESHVTTLEVIQRSKSELDQNGSDARSCLYLGYGYNIFKALDNAMSVRTTEAILNYQSLTEMSFPSTYEVIHESRLSRTEMKYYNALSLQEFSSQLTSSSSNSDIELQGSIQNCNDAMKCCSESSVRQQNFGMGSMVKTVASRLIDKGALLDLRAKHNLPFTTAFTIDYQRVKQSKGSAQEEAILRLLNKYGTHLIIQTDLGGRIDYTFTLNKELTVNNEGEMREEVDYTLGHLTLSDRNKNYQHSTSSQKNLPEAITLRGGSEDSRAAMKKALLQLTPESQISPELITEWLSTVNYEESPAYSPNLDVIHFELFPLWDLVDDELRTAFINVTLKLSQQSDCQLSSRFLGTDVYTIRSDSKDLTDFSKVGRDGSLSRLLFLRSGGKMEPVLLACSEYVPAIRTDQRVTILYPICDRRMRMNQGLFIGDGIHQPAFVGFSKSDCYVNPIDTLPTGRIIRTVYYINGNLHLDSKGIIPLDEQQLGRTVIDDEMIFRTAEDSKMIVHRHPVVKIGSLFWTRHDIDHEMLFTLYGGDDSNTRDVITNDLLFTNFQYDVCNISMVRNSWTFGYKPITALSSKPNTKWYLPLPANVEELYAFIGFNPKSLFRGQVSGFEAAFNGYLGKYDLCNGNSVINGSTLKTPQYQGKLNIISAKINDKGDGSCLLMLDDRYRLTCVNDASSNSKWRGNFYPVRLCRGSFYTFHTLETIQSKYQ